MKPDLRALIAFTAGCSLTGTNYSYLFDQLQDQVLQYEYRADNTYVTAIDRQTGSELMGTVTGKEISLFHSDERIAIRINLNDTKFTGKCGDFGSFNGEITERIVKLYDYEEGKYFNFCLISDTK